MSSDAGRALVIGASAGIGRATALRLGELGFELAVVGRRQDRLDEVADATGAMAIAADVSDSARCRLGAGRADVGGPDGAPGAARGPRAAE